MLKSKKLALSLTILFLVGCAQEPNDENKVVKESPTKKELTAQQETQVPRHELLIKEAEQRDSKQASSKQKIAKDQSQVKIQPYLASPHVSPQQLRVISDIRQQNFTGSTHPARIHPSHTQELGQDREKYNHAIENSVKLVQESPVSTFSIDVDTASYANVRRILNQGRFPLHDAVRVEELINYFSYDYSLAPKESAKQPFSVYTEVAPSPYNVDKHLLHIGIQGKTIENNQRPASNLVFLIDVSGSMNSTSKIGLLKNSLKMLSKQLNNEDRVAIVVYAGAAGVVLETTAGDNRHAIANALEKLSAGGSTNGGAGIQAAYNLAQQSFIKGGINRVILATDGDFNVGTVNQQALKNLIEQKRKSGIALSVLGFGMGNYNDGLMQELAQNGNGNAYYIDTLNEARKVLVEELSATLMIIAKDVKIQVEFNPQVANEYRLVGYETRALNREDFNNDKVDAGEIGAGHTVTALYEVSFVDAKNKLIDNLRYQKIDNKMANYSAKKVNLSTELAYLRLRYKMPEQGTSQLIEMPIMLSSVKDSLQSSSDNFRFSAAVAGFGQLLRGGKNLSDMTLEQVIRLAQNAKGTDSYGYRSEFINIVKLADALSLDEQAIN
ncbi:MAG: VWA domain-containing protein [Colwellia sp.]|nr:VWA domain-containing protein [Colwellia sp.]